MTKGLDFLLGNSMKPLMIIQNEVYRNQNKSSGFNWLFIMDRNYGNQNCLKILIKFLPFVDAKKDIVQCNVYLPSGFKDDIEKACTDVAKNNNFANFNYKSDYYSGGTALGKTITDHVNFGQTNYDFVVVLNNPNSYQINKEKSDVAYIISKCKANICVAQS